ncbi:PIR protein [Plasmodium ovale]|uniref:PIR protein n=1 Tax=Plasmodium ovale TaxID=36330 RepID=A0A1D3JF19_PLAOA|nr:PIR protein [Plasmodium ovale]
MAAEKDPDLKELHANVIYYKLDTATNDYINDNHAFWNTFVKYHKLKELRIFDALAKGLYYVCTMSKSDTFYDERWNYLYFWSGLKILENSKSSESSEFSDLMILLKTARSLFDKEKGSYKDDMFTINKDKFRNLKDIYDYLENYQSIDLKIGYSDNAPCTEAYKDYITKTHSLYTNEKQGCQHNDRDKYCRILNSFLTKHVKTFITQPTCNSTIRANPFSEALYPQDTVDSEGSGPQHQALHTAGGHPGQDGGISTSSGSSNTLSTVFPLLGTASLALFFLKFTPLGSRLYSSIFRKQIIRSNEQEEPQEILGNTYEISHTNIDDTAHHISYHSM